MSVVRKDLRTGQRIYESWLRVDENGISVMTELGWFELNDAEQDEVYKELKAIRSQL